MFAPMSSKQIRGAAARAQLRARLFAALGHPVRLALIGELAGASPRSISELTRVFRLGSGARLTRQAITKHLRVLESAGIVRCSQAGRESLFEYDPEPVAGLRSYIDEVSANWDETLERLKAFVET